MADQAIHIAFATDNNYVQHLGVAIRSMLEHTDASGIVAHIVCLDVEAENIDRLRELFLQYPCASGYFYAFDARAYRHFRVDHYISLASYIRLFLADLLPPDVEKLVYLDSDICVLADIRELAATDLGGAVVAAAPDVYADENERLGLPEGYAYFNAGVLVMDMAAWRRLGLTAAAQRYVEENTVRLKYHDQDALNGLLHDRAASIDMAWNYQARLPRKDLLPPGADPKRFAGLARVRPKIVHYTTHLKPWFYWPDIPHEREYLSYVRLTPWADFRQPDKDWKAVARRYINRCSPRAAVWLTRASAKLRGAFNAPRTECS